MRAWKCIANMPCLTTSNQTRLSTSEVVMALSFIHDDRVAQLDILSVVAIVAFIQSPASRVSTAIHHLQHTAFHWASYFFVTEKTKKARDTRERLVCYVSQGLRCIKSEKWKRQIQQSVDPSSSLFLCLGIWFFNHVWEARVRRCLQDKAVWSPEMATLVCICLCVNSSNYKALTQVVERNTQLKMSFLYVVHCVVVDGRRIGWFLFLWLSSKPCWTEDKSK